MSDTLLPASATSQEIDLDLTTARIGAVPVQVNAVWSAANCPVALLPWLAWALAVENWDPTWTEAQQRGAILASFGVHQHHGTPGGLQRAIQALGYTVTIVEWFTESAAPYTFRIEITTVGHVIDDAEYAVLSDLINEVKNCRSSLTSLDSVTSTGEAPLFICGGTMSGETTEVYPFPSGSQWDAAFFPLNVAIRPTIGMSGLEANFDGSQGGYGYYNTNYMRGTVSKNSGQRYFEIYVQEGAGDVVPNDSPVAATFGIIPAAADGSLDAFASGGIMFGENGHNVYVGANPSPIYIPPYPYAPDAVTGSYIGIAVDFSTGIATVYWIIPGIIGSLQSTVTFTPGTAMLPCVMVSINWPTLFGQFILNTGQSAFSFGLPVGYEPWDT